MAMKSSKSRFFIFRKNFLKKVLTFSDLRAIMQLKVKESQSQKGDVMKLSNLIEEFIKDMMKEENGAVELQRNELAGRFNCVPSQINYVISTRFSPERGYIVESRRGGGGYIKITRAVCKNEESYIQKVLSLVGDYISQTDADAVIQNLYELDVISQREGKIMTAAVRDNAIPINPPQRDFIRAKLLKNILVNIL